MDAQEATEPNVDVEGVAPDATPPAETAQDTIDSLPDWVQSVVKDLRTENAKHRTANKAAEKAAAMAEEEQLLAKGKIQEAYDKVRGEYDTLTAELKASEILRHKMQIAQKFNLPDELMNRLRGDTLEEMEEDAEILAALIPETPDSPPPVNTDGASGVNASTSTPQMSSSEINEMAVRMGVNPQHLKQSLGIEN